MYFVYRRRSVVGDASCDGLVDGVRLDVLGNVGQRLQPDRPRLGLQQVVLVQAGDLLMIGEEN